MQELSESLHVEIEGALVQLPKPGDLLSVKVDDETRTGMCLGSNPTFRHGGKRLPLVKMLFEGRVLMLPLEQVIIVQQAKTKNNSKK